MNYATVALTVVASFAFLDVTHLYGQSEFNAQGKNQNGQNNVGNVTNNDCKLVLRNFEVSNGSTVINDLHCPISSEKSFSVRYVWLTRILRPSYLQGSFRPLCKNSLGRFEHCS